MRDYLRLGVATLSLLTSAAMADTASTATTAAPERHPFQLLPEFRQIGGVGNNLDNAALNLPPGSPERQLAPLNFAASPRNGLVGGPNPRLISNLIAGGDSANGQNAQTPDPVASAWLYVFGQFLDHDLGLEHAPLTNEAIDIPIPPNDPVFPSGSSIAMNRDDRSTVTNTIINTTAGFLDLSQLYGSTLEKANSLRNPDGTLKSSANGTALGVVNGQFVSGDPRVMENPELVAVTTLFMREHNYWVARIGEQNPEFSGDQRYDLARAITTAEYQNIVYQEYLPLLIGPVIRPYKGYNPKVNAQVSQEFSTAAFRVGHSQISETQSYLDNHGVVTFTQSLAQAFFNTPDDDLRYGIDAHMRNVTAEFSQATDPYVVPVLRNLLFAGLVGGGVDLVDLIAIDIQRERDVGIGTLNQTRSAIGLAPYRSFAQLTDDAGLQADLKSLYGSVDAVDLFIGGVVERHANRAIVGETFQAIIREQFQALMDGDRFFWLNQAFDPKTRKSIAATTLGSIIKRNTDTTVVPDAVFVAATKRAPKPKGRDGRDLDRNDSNQVNGGVNIDDHGRRGKPFLTP